MPESEVANQSHCFKSIHNKRVLNDQIMVNHDLTRVQLNIMAATALASYCISI